MAKDINVGFDIKAPMPIDVKRTQVATWVNLMSIQFKYDKLKTYVIDEDADYRYTLATQTWAKVSSGSGVLSRDVEVLGIASIGAMSEHDKFNAGDDLAKVLEDLVQKVVPPTYVEPTSSLIVSPNSTREIGSTVDYILSPGFSKNDAGDITSVKLYDRTILLITQINTEEYEQASQEVLPGYRSYSTVITYAKGPIKEDNFGNEDDTDQVQAGSLTSSRSVLGSYYNFYGPMGDEIPTDGQDVRDNGLRTFSNSFILNTGTTAKATVIACPAGKTIISVIDLDAFDLPIKDEYVLTGVTTVPDGKGVDATFNVYCSRNTAAPASNHRHQITLG